MVKKIFSKLVIPLVFLGGLSLLLYPSVSNWWNSMHQSASVAAYVGAVENMTEAEHQRMWEAAVEYNRRLSETNADYTPSEDALAEYYALLDVSGTGIMGYVDIPRIHVTLPVYHGTDEDILQVAVGHIAGSSLPVGGETTHCIVSGHRGLPSTKLFTDVDQLVPGDEFSLCVLGETLTYVVDQIRTVLPNELQDLQREAGEDYCTLVTCTPYGVNTHRLLVRGHRTETAEAGAIRLTSEAYQIEPLVVTPIVGGPLLLLVLWMLHVDDKRTRKSYVLPGLNRPGK